MFPAPTFPLPAEALLWHHAGELGQPRLFLSFAEMTVKTREIDTELTHPCSAVDTLEVLAPFFVCVVGFGIFLLLFAFKKPQKVMRCKNLHRLSHLLCPFLRHRPEKGISWKKRKVVILTLLCLLSSRSGYISGQISGLCKYYCQCLLQVIIHLHIFLTTVIL